LETAAPVSEISEDGSLDLDAEAAGLEQVSHRDFVPVTKMPPLFKLSSQFATAVPSEITATAIPPIF